MLSPESEAQKENQKGNAKSSTKSKRSILKGTFFSKTTSEVGTWECDEGSLIMKWDLSGRILEFAQTNLNSELDWSCDGSATDLQFMNLKGNKYLPAWIMPRDPADMRLDASKATNDRDVRAKIEEGRARGAIASGYNECALCFFELHLLPAAILRYQSKRACPHYFHSTCAEAYRTRLEKSNKRLGCPVCAQRFTGTLTILF